MPNENDVGNVQDQNELDPWAAAFEALDKAGKEDPEDAAATGGDSGNEPGDGTGNDSEQGVSDSFETGVGAGAQAGAGELDLGSGDTAEENENVASNLFRVPEGYSDQYRKNLEDDIRAQAIEDIAREFIKRGVRNTNGVIGATISDPDIRKRDEDGVPHYYNPETGREFTSDNPRGEAQKWVDDYNKELIEVYNNACAQYEQHLLEERKPALAVIEFAPKYEKLDPIRRGMFEDVISDYEIKDGNGAVIGYSCDLDKALALVDRQVKTIQSHAKTVAQTKQQASGPLLDMKTSSGAVIPDNQSAPTSLAEAMERLQDAQLAKMKR